ncbi:hypothetical protein [Streptomyces pinistramenti]|uniref:hypothetical protein n=1 Tax=Streptomyces pinistramenti TaxID=2884812 RepID=UPI001D085685|nr:hypothetical protein [Streptomyces pinistramenti]MCB5906821.1 hypothetical protein [Streptomyces pinistramenti]
MRVRCVVPLCAAAVLAAGCSQGEARESEETDSVSAESSALSDQEGTASGGRVREWNPKRALQRANRALRYDDDDASHPVLVATEGPYIATGMAKKFKATGKRNYRLDTTCDTQGVGELTLTLSRGDVEQPYGITCGDHRADQFNIPPGEPFTATIDPVKDGTGLILWELNTVAPDKVRDCPDDIKGCDY